MLQDRPTSTDSMAATLDEAKLDDEARAVFNWLVDVCARSTSTDDQIFIFRDLSVVNKLFKRDKRGEVKAIGMSDILRVHGNQIRDIHESYLIKYRKGRWPGKWFTVNLEGAS